MEILNADQISSVSGGDSRENTQVAASVAAGTVTGGNGFVMAFAAWAAGLYYDFQGGVNVNGPSGPSSNHLSTDQYRQITRA